MNARFALVLAALAGLLAAAGCSSQARSASEPASHATAAPPLLAANAAAPVSINGTLVDCGPGRQALVQQVSGAVGVSCVGPPSTAFGVEPAFASQPIGYAVPNALAPTTRTVYQDAPARPRTVARRSEGSGRSWKKSAAIIGGSAAAGAGVGALLDGGSGAKKGAVVGLVGGTIYDLATRSR